MAFVLVVSAVVVYQCSYHIIWFKVGSLFDITMAPSKAIQSQEIPKWELNDSTFFYKLYSEYSISSHRIKNTVRILFSIAMVSYAMTVEIVLWQIRTAEVDQRADFLTKMVWPCVSILLSMLIILTQPFLIVLSLLNKFYKDRFDIERLLIYTCMLIAFLIACLSILSFGPFKYTKSMLTKISMVGITVMAFLSGVASISTLHYTFLFIKKRWFPTSVREDDRDLTANTSRALLWTGNDMINERIASFQQNIQEDLLILKKVENEKDGGSLPRRDQVVERIAESHLEIAKLEHRIQQSRKILLMKKAFHLSFLLYCLHKVIFTFTRSIPNIVGSWSTNRDSQSQESARGPSEWVADPLAITLAKVLDFLLFKFNYQYELDSLTKQISLLLSVSLFICSLSTVATTISIVITILPTKFRALAMYTMQSTEKGRELPKYRKEGNHNRKPPSIIKNLIVSELTGIYVVATVLSVRSNLPFEVSEKVNELLGQRFTVPNIVIDSWFDLIYAFSCIFTIAFMKIAERVLSK